MKYLTLFFLGLFVSSVFWGVWWLFLLSGVATLITKRSYIVISVGVLMDIIFAATDSAWIYTGFYTTVFLFTTLIVEFVRERVFWKS